MEVTFFTPFQRTGLNSGDGEQLMLLLGDDTGSDSLEKQALLLNLFPSLSFFIPAVALVGMNWKDMGSKSKVEIPATGEQRSKSSSWWGGDLTSSLHPLSGP